MKYFNQFIKKRLNGLGFWIWERSDKIMKALRSFLLIIITATAIVFAINLIIENRKEGFALVLPVILALTVPAICGGLLLFAWTLTERSREDKERFNANCIAWVTGFIFLAAIIALVRDFSISSFPLFSQRAPIWEIFWLVPFVLIGHIFLWRVHLLSNKVSLSIFIFMLVAGSSTALYSYYCISLDNWLMILSLFGFVFGGCIYAMINPEAVSLIKGE